MPDRLYVFIDESGNFDFSPKGTAFYTFTSIVTRSPLKFVSEINKLQLDILTGDLLPGLPQNYLDKLLSEKFHAAEDKQNVRDLFFQLIQTMDNLEINSVVIRKNRTNPSLRSPEMFYPRFLGSLMAYVFKTYAFSDLCIFVDGCVVNSNKESFKKTIASELRKRDPKVAFKLYFPPSAGSCTLQIVDYVNWAIYKKWESKDIRSYALIQKFFQSPERDIFRFGDVDYY